MQPTGGPDAALLARTAYDAGARFYAAEYREAVGDLDWFAERTMAGDRVLDVGAGAGRVAAHLVRTRRCRAVALDLSGAMLQLVPRVGGLDPVQADACRLPFAGGTFRAVFFTFGTYGFLVERAMRLRALEESRRVLEPGGLLAIDVFEPSGSAGSSVREFTDTDTGDRIRKHVAEVEATAGVLEVRHRYERLARGPEPDVLEEAVMEFRLAVLRRSDIEAELIEAGFVPMAVFGDYRGNPHRPTRSPRILAEAISG